MGFDAVSAIEVMKGAEDMAMIRKAKGENRIIVANGKDLDGSQPSTSRQA